MEKIKMKEKSLPRTLEGYSPQIKLIADSFYDELSVIDKDFKTIWANKAFCKNYNISKEEVEGKFCYKLTHELDEPCDSPECECPVMHVWNTGEKSEVIHIHHQGRARIYLELIAYPIKDKAGNVIYVVKVGKDITMRKRMEEKLMQSKEKYKSLIEKAPVAIIIINMKGKITECNKHSEKLVGLKKNEVIGKNYTMLNIIPEEYLNSSIEEFNKAKSGNKISTGQIKLRNKNGSILWVQYQSSIINIGKKKLFQIIAQDITLRKIAEEIIIEENKNLKKLDRLKTAFISNASHELKTPMTPIIGYSQLLLKDKSLNEMQRQYINGIRMASLKLKNLVGDLIDISKIESDYLQLNIELIDFKSLIELCISDLEFQIKIKNLKIIKNLCEDIKLRIDKDRILQVLTNLFSNSIKYTHSEGIIEISTKVKNGNYIFSIKDNGIGIDDNEKDIIFKRFGKIKAVNISKNDVDMQGTGLGLYITKEIIKLHGGKIWFESEGKNKGTTFFFTIPINENPSKTRRVNEFTKTERNLMNKIS